MKTLRESKKSLIKLGNLQTIKSDEVIRKIKTVAMAHQDRDKNDIIDLIKMQEEHGEYIKEVCTPFLVKIYSQQQFDVLEKQASLENVPVIYFDATGGIVRKPNKNCKRVYLYSAVIPLRHSKRIFPIFEMFSASHYSKTIYKIFYDFRTYCEEKSKWPIFKAVVTDFSFANIHAIIKSCNQMSLIQYLETCYKTIKRGEKTQIPESFVTVHLSCAHFLKMVTRDANDYFNDSKIRNVYKTLLAKCVQLKNISSIEHWFRNLVMLLNTRLYNEIVEAAYANMCLIGETDDILSILDKSEIDLVEDVIESDRL
uniref:NOF-FB transposable element associated protein n=1 Tax=Anoplophora glabripennis TaxID=217634 RepID=V5G888_ANOGL